MDLFLLPLQVLYLRVQLIELNLLPFNLLIIVREFFLTLFLLFLHFGQLLLTIEHVVLALAQVFFSNPTLPLFVTLLVHKVS